MASLLQLREDSSSTFNVIASPWSGCNMKDHEITAIAHCCEYGITATGSSAGWIYLWKPERKNASQNNLAPYVACVSQGGREFSVVQCYFVPWKHSYLVGMSFPVVLISHHANGLLKYWSVGDGRFLLVLSTTAFLGSTAIDSQLIANTQFLLLTTHRGLILLDLWRQCPCIVFSFCNPSHKEENGLCNSLPVESMLVLRFFTSFHLLKSQNNNFDCMASEDEMGAQNITEAHHPSYDAFSKINLYSYLSQSPIQDVAINNECVKRKTISSISSSHTFVIARLQNCTFYIWDITLALKNWRNSISIIQENNETNLVREKTCAFSPYLITAFPLQIVKFKTEAPKYLSPFCFESNVPNQHTFQYPMSPSLSSYRLSLDATCIALLSENDSSIYVYKRTHGTNNFPSHLWEQRQCQQFEEGNMVYDSRENRLELLVPKKPSKSLLRFDASFVGHMTSGTSTWVGLHMISEATMHLWESLVQCDSCILPKFTGHDLSSLCTLLMGYASDGRIFVYNLSIILHALSSGKATPLHSYVNLISIPYNTFKTSCCSPNHLFGKVIFEQLGATACSLACYIITISSVSSDAVNILHYYFDCHRKEKWSLCCCLKSVSINGMWDRNNNFSSPVALVTKPEPFLIHYKTSKATKQVKKTLVPSLALGEKHGTASLPSYDKKQIHWLTTKNNCLQMLPHTAGVRKTVDHVVLKKTQNNFLRGAAKKSIQITLSTMYETSTNKTRSEPFKERVDREKDATRLTCFLSFSDTLLVGGSYQGDIVFWSLPACNKRLTLPSIHMTAVVMLMPLKVLCTGTAENKFHPTFFCSIDSSSNIVLVEAYGTNVIHDNMSTNVSRGTDQRSVLEHSLPSFQTSFEEYDLIPTNHDDLFNSPLMSITSRPHTCHTEADILGGFYPIDKCIQHDINGALSLEREIPSRHAKVPLCEGDMELNIRANTAQISQARVLRLRRQSTLMWQDIKEISLDSRQSIVFVKSATVGLFLFSSYSGGIITHIDLYCFTSKLVYAACVAALPEEAGNSVEKPATLLCPFSNQMTTCEDTLKTFQSLWCQWFELWRNSLYKSVLFQSFCKKKWNQNVFKNQQPLSKYFFNDSLTIPQLWNGFYGSHEVKRPFFLSSVTLLPMCEKPSAICYDSCQNGGDWSFLKGVCRVPVISISLKECLTHHITSPLTHCRNNQESFSFVEMFLCRFFLQQLPNKLFNSICMKLSKRQISCLRQLRTEVWDHMWILGLGNSSSSFSWIFPRERVTTYRKHQNPMVESYITRECVLPFNKCFSVSNHSSVNRTYFSSSRIPLAVNDDCFVLKNSSDNMENARRLTAMNDMCHIFFFERSRGIHSPVKVCKNVNEKHMLHDFKRIADRMMLNCGMQNPKLFRSKSVPKFSSNDFLNFRKRPKITDFQNINNAWNVEEEKRKFNKILNNMEGKKDTRNFSVACDLVLSSYVTFVYSCMLHYTFMNLQRYLPTLWSSSNCYNTFCLTEKYKFEILAEVFLNIILLEDSTSSILALWSYFMLCNTACSSLFSLCWKWCSFLCRLLNDKEWKECFNFSSDVLRHIQIRECPNKCPWVLSMSYTMSRSDVILCHTMLFDSPILEMPVSLDKNSTMESIENIVQWSVLMLFLFCFEKPQVFISSRLHHLNRYNPLGILLLHFLLETVEDITILSPIYGMWLLEMFRTVYPLIYRYMIKNDPRSSRVLMSVERQFHTSHLLNVKDINDYERWNIFQTEAYKELKMSMRCEESLLLPFHNLVLGLYSLSLNQFLKRHAFHNLLCLSLYDPLLFIKTFQYAMRRLDIGTFFCHTGLLLLTHFFLKYPSLAIHYLTNILEVSIYCLDPAHPFLRRNCLELSTNLLCQLVRTFPMAVFHQATQRVAVGTYTGFIVIYDLRTTSKSYVVKAGSEPVDVVAFTKDGNKFASYNKTTQMFCLWQCSSSGFLAGVIRQTNDCQKFLKLPRLTEESLLEAYNNPKGMELTFRDQHHWLLRREDGKTYVICV